jgi:GNAT superfamily N-acetyltransferase
MHKVQEIRQGNYLISTDRQRLDIDYVHDYLCNQSYWAAGIPREIVQKSIQGSFCFGLYYQQNQIGFARVITDQATFGYLADVFIDTNFRGKGLSKWLMQFILSHPSLQGFRRWLLGTRDAQGLYSKFGFESLDHPERVMQKFDPHVYTLL